MSRNRSTIKTFINKIFFLFFVLRIITCANILRYIKFFFKRYVLGRKIPALAVLAVTYRCQCACLHCSAGRYEKDDNEMSTRQWLQCIDAVALRGIPRVHFSGGEPLLRRDITELLSHAHKKGIMCFLETNGCLFDEIAAGKIKKTGVASVNISIDSADGGVHDNLRNLAGCFDRAIQAIIRCRARGIAVMISTYASRRSLLSGDLRKIVVFAKRMSVSALRVLPPQPSGRWLQKDAERLNAEETASIDDLMLASVPLLNRVKPVICPIATGYTVFVAPDGRVHPCAHLPFSFGNVKETDLKKIIDIMSAHVMFRKKGLCFINNDAFRKKYIAPIREKQKLPVKIV